MEIAQPLGNNIGKPRKVLAISFLLILLAIVTGGLTACVLSTAYIPSSYMPFLLVAPILPLCLLVILASPSWGLVALLLLFYNPVTLYALLNVSEWSYAVTFVILGVMFFPLAISSRKTAAPQRYPTWWWQIYVALLIYEANVVLSALHGWLIGNDVRYVISDFLQFSEFAILYWLTTQILLRSGQFRKIITWAFLLFLPTLVWELATYFGIVPLLSSNVASSLFQASVGGKLVRRGISNTPFLFMPVILAVLLMAGKRISLRIRLLLYLSLLLAALSVLFSFTRSFWLGLLVAFAFLLLMGWKSTGVKVIPQLVVVLLVIASISSLVSLQGQPLLGWLISRAKYTLLQITDVSNLGRVSRLLEYQAVQKALQVSPVLGMGLGSKYWGYDAVIGGLALKHYIHNFYLALVFRMGVLGVVTTGWCLTTIFMKNIRRIKGIRDVMERALVIGLLASFLALAIQALVYRNLLSHPLSAYVGFGLGLATHLSTERRQKGTGEHVKAPAGQ